MSPAALTAEVEGEAMGAALDARPGERRRWRQSLLGLLDRLQL